MIARAKLPIILLLLAVATGCASRKCWDSSCDSTATTPVFDCRQTEPQPILPDISAVGPFDAGEKPIYCALPEQDVQCLAALHSPLGNLLTQEAEAVVEQPGRAHVANRNLLRQLIQFAATHQRNQDAASAMEVYLRLVEAEAGVWNIDKQLEQIDLTLADIRALTEQGLLSPVSRNEVENQKLELQHRQVDLQPTIRGLNEQLARLLNVELPAGSRFWPEIQLVVDPLVPDAEEAILLALSNRADLAALYYVSQSDPRDYAAAVQLFMQQVSGGITSPVAPPRWPILYAHAVDREAMIRGNQIDLILVDRQQQVRNETIQAVELLKTRLAQIDLTRQRLALARQRIQAHEQQQQLTSGGPFTLRKARSDAILLEQTLLHDTIEWKLALVKLKQAQGLLAIECGYGTGLCCD